jgi:hypothetical protein
MAKSKTAVPKAAKSATKKAATKKATPAKAVAKKARTRSAAGKKKEPTINIKYADKSAGQPELLEIFEAIKKMMLPYDKKRHMVLHAATGGQANLVSHKPVEIDGRKRNELWFVSALVQKGYVGFYYTPVYMQGELKKHFSEDFVKSLKGKACFHIKKNDPVIMADIRKAIKVGYEAFIERGWI